MTNYCGCFVLSDHKYPILGPHAQQLLSVHVCFCRLAGDQRARRDVRPDSDAEDDDDIKKVKIETALKNIFVSESDICVVFKSQAF